MSSKVSSAFVRQIAAVAVLPSPPPPLLWGGMFLRITFGIYSKYVIVAFL